MKFKDDSVGYIFAIAILKDNIFVCKSVNRSKKNLKTFCKKRTKKIHGLNATGRLIKYLIGFLCFYIKLQHKDYD